MIFRFFNRFQKTKEIKETQETQEPNNMTSPEPRFKAWFHDMNISHLTNIIKFSKKQCKQSNVPGYLCVFVNTSTFMFWPSETIESKENTKKFKNEQQVIDAMKKVVTTKQKKQKTKDDTNTDVIICKSKEREDLDLVLHKEFEPLLVITVLKIKTFENTSNKKKMKISKTLLSKCFEKNKNHGVFIFEIK